MRIAVFAAIFVLAAGVLGRLFKPTEEQMRPLTPEPSLEGAAHDDQGHGAHHH